MIGGTIINIEEFKDKIRLDLVDDKTKDKLSVYVELSAAAKCIQEDDSAWVQNQWVLWTPKMRYFHDYKLNKVGNTFVTPSTQKEEVRV